MYVCKFEFNTLLTPSHPHTFLGAITSDSDDEFTFYSYSDDEGEDGLESAAAVDHYESLVGHTP